MMVLAGDGAVEVSGEVMTGVGATSASGDRGGGGGGGVVEAEAEAETWRRRVTKSDCWKVGMLKN